MPCSGSTGAETRLLPDYTEYFKIPILFIFLCAKYSYLLAQLTPLSLTLVLTPIVQWYNSKQCTQTQKQKIIKPIASSFHSGIHSLNFEKPLLCEI